MDRSREKEASVRWIEQRRWKSFWLVVPLATAVGLSAVGAESDTAVPQTPANVGASPVAAKAAACAWTLERFVPELDAVMRENPRSILRYDAVLAKYLFFNNGVPGLPPPLPDAAVEGCIVDQVVEIVKRSEFFYVADGPPQYQHYRIEFRNTAAKVAFSIEKTTGNIIGPSATWIKVCP